MTCSDRKRIDVWLSRAKVARYASPKAVYGNADSTTIAAALVYVRAAARSLVEVHWRAA